MLIDTHTHLYSEAFNDDIDAVIARAKEKGITRFYLPAIDSSHTQAMYRLKDKYPNEMYLMTGLHPTSVKENFKTELKHVVSQLKEKTFCAIGEIGIDLYWDKTTLEIQKEAFSFQIQLAKQHKLPIVIHCREAFDEIFEVLEQHKGADLFGIFHCFTGTIEHAEKAISYNMKLGIGGVVTFKNGKIDTFLSAIPLEHIVLETDSPYLAPVPYRGKRNESSYLSLICEKVTQVYNTTYDEIASRTSKNALKIFGHYTE